MPKLLTSNCKHKFCLALRVLRSDLSSPHTRHKGYENVQAGDIAGIRTPHCTVCATTFSDRIHQSILLYLNMKANVFHVGEYSRCSFTFQSFHIVAQHPLRWSTGTRVLSLEVQTEMENKTKSGSQIPFLQSLRNYCQSQMCLMDWQNTNYIIP